MTLTHHLSRTLSATLAPLLLLPSSALGQKIHDIHLGSLSQENLGFAVAMAGDVNGDGFDDIVAGAPNANFGMGRVQVWSGVDGTLLYSIDAPASGALGTSVDGAGDVDGDGFDDFVAGAPGSGAGGEAIVYSGMDGSVLHTLLPGNPLIAEQGQSVAGVGDVDGDGFDDVAVGNPTDNTGPNLTSGSATVYSGADGSVLYRWFGDNHVDAMGTSVAGAGDVNNDGSPDVIAGAVRSDNNGSLSGMARVYSGLDGSILYTFDGLGQGDEFGFAIDGAGDVNGDDFDDLIVGSDEATYVHVYSGFDGSLLHDLTGTGSPTFGWSVAGLGDMNGDGMDDFLIGEFAPLVLMNRARVQVHSGQTGSVLFSMYSDDTDGRFGQAVGGGGDVDGDGLPDFVVGDWADSDSGQGNSGSVWVMGAASAVGTNYCSPAVSNSTGFPGRITAYGSTIAADNCLTLRVDDIGTGEFGFFLVSAVQGSFMPPGSQGVLCLSGNIGRYNQFEEIFMGFSMSNQLDLTQVPQNPNIPVQAGQTWNFQAWYRDNNTSNFTDAVSITFQ